MKVDQPWMKLFIGDWLRDTSKLKMAARGAYTQLRCHMWMNDERGVITGDITDVSLLLGVNTHETEILLQEIFSKRVFECEKLAQGVMRIVDLEMIDKVAKSAAKSRAGKEGMEKRYGRAKKNSEKKNDSVITDDITNVITDDTATAITKRGIWNMEYGNGIENEEGVQGEGQTEPPSPSQPGNGDIQLPFKSLAFAAAWKTWKEYKWEQHQWRYSWQSEMHALEYLWKLAEGNEKAAIELIKVAIGNGWKNFYIKNSSDGNNNAGGKRAYGAKSITSSNILKPGESFWGDER